MTKRPGPFRTGLAAALLAAVVLAPAADAQNGRPYIRKTDYSVNDARTEAVQKMLQDLLERELENRGESPNRTAPMGTFSPATVAPSVDNRDLTNVQRAVADFASEADKLSVSLSGDVRYVPGVRDQIADVLNLRSRSALLAQRMRTNADLYRIIPDLRALDTQWRNVSFRLRELRGLSRASTDSIARMDADLRVVERVLELGQQIDRTALFRETSALSSGMSALLDDLEFELASDPNARTLLLEGRKVEQQARFLSVSVSDRSSVEEIKAEYNRFNTMWRGYVSRLYQLRNRYVERSVRRVQDRNDAVRDLLQLPNEINTQELQHLTAVLQRDVDEFFSRAPLKLMIELPRGNEVIPAADMFYGVSQNFLDVVSRGEKYEDIVDAYGYITDAWDEFYLIFKPMKSQAALNVLGQIEKSMLALRTELGVKDAFDRQEALRIVGELEAYASHLEADTKLWLERERPSWRTAALRETEQFARSCSDLHQLMLNSRVDQRLVEQRVNTLFDQWQKTWGYVSQCRTADRDHLQRLAAKIMPDLLQLQANVVK